MTGLYILLNCQVIFSTSPRVKCHRRNHGIINIDASLPSGIVRGVGDFYRPQRVALTGRIAKLLSACSSYVLPPRHTLKRLMSGVSTSFVTEYEISFSSELGFNDLRRNLFGESLLLFKGQ